MAPPDRGVVVIPAPEGMFVMPPEGVIISPPEGVLIIPPEPVDGLVCEEADCATRTAAQPTASSQRKVVLEAMASP
jgi:hypothetical protein